MNRHGTPPHLLRRKTTQGANKRASLYHLRLKDVHWLCTLFFCKQERLNIVFCSTRPTTYYESGTEINTRIPKHSRAPKSAPVLVRKRTPSHRTRSPSALITPTIILLVLLCTPPTTCRQPHPGELVISETPSSKGRCPL